MRYKVTNIGETIARVERVGIGPRRSGYFEQLPPLPDGSFRVEAVDDEIPDDVAEAEAIQVRRRSRSR